MGLQKAIEFDDIDALPIPFDSAWYAQKIVLDLLTLRALGVKEIRVGRTLPGFLSPGAAQTLIEKFDLKPIAKAHGIAGSSEK